MSRILRSLMRIFPVLSAVFIVLLLPGCLKSVEGDRGEQSLPAPSVSPAVSETETVIEPMFPEIDEFDIPEEVVPDGETVQEEPLDSLEEISEGEDFPDFPELPDPGDSPSALEPVDPIENPVKEPKDENIIPDSDPFSEGKPVSNNYFAGQAAYRKVNLPQVADLEPQIPYYLDKLEKNLESIVDESDFEIESDTLYRDASVLAVIALALGLSEEDGKYKKAAPAIIKGARAMESAGTKKEAEKALAMLKESLSAEEDPGRLKWGKVASLKPLMKAVPTINTLVKRNLRTESALQKSKNRVQEGAAALVVIGQGSLPNVKETSNPAAEKDWEEQCFIFRDAALQLNRKTHGFFSGKVKYEEIQAAYDELYETCDRCHKLFYDGEIEID